MSPRDLMRSLKGHILYKRVHNPDVLHISLLSLSYEMIRGPSLGIASVCSSHMFMIEHVYM